MVLQHKIRRNLAEICTAALARVLTYGAALAWVIAYGALTQTEIPAHAATLARVPACNAALTRAILCNAYPIALLVPPARIADLVRTQTPVCVVDLAQIILKIQAEFLREISKFPLQILREILKIQLAIRKPSLRKASKIKTSRRVPRKTVEAPSQIPS